MPNLRPAILLACASACAAQTPTKPALPTFSDQVTVTATGLPTPLAESGAPITILTQDQFPFSPEIQQPLRLIPGLQMTQAGQTGSVASLFIRGGESRANKVLLDGIPVNDVGGLVNFANIASTGIARIEVLRQPNSALYGSDALAGVVSFTTAHGSTPIPQFTYAIDGGNLGLFRQEATLGGTHRRLDLFTAAARLNTSNSLPNDAFHNATVTGNYGFAPNTQTDLRFIFRHLTTAAGVPNAFNFFGLADNASQREQDTFLNAFVSHQTTPRWHNLLRYGHEALNAQYQQFPSAGILYTPPGQYPEYIGKQVTITGANGYSASGQAVLDYSETTSNTSAARRDFGFLQSDFRLTPHLVALGAVKYEAERGGATAFSTFTVGRRNQSYTAQLAGDLHSRLFFVAGSGIEKNAVFGSALTPRLSLAYYLFRPAAQPFLSGTKLHASFGKGIKESNVYEENLSLYRIFSNLPNGSALIAQYHLRPIGAEYSRTYDAGIEQLFADGRARINLTFFHNQFTNGIEYLSPAGLKQIGATAASNPAVQYGAHANSLAFRALGGEAEFEYRLNPHLFVRSGYTFLDARVQRSFSSDNDGTFPNFNPAFPTVQIGAYGPLRGNRPFRRAPHSGFFAFDYTRNRLDAHLSGTLVGRRDDSTFLSDKDGGSTLLLPNRNLDGSYQRLELTASYHLTRHLTTYADAQNLLNQHFSEAIGYPALPFNVRGGLRLTLGGEPPQPRP